MGQCQCFECSRRLLHLKFWPSKIKDLALSSNIQELGLLWMFKWDILKPGSPPMESTCEVHAHSYAYREAFRTPIDHWVGGHPGIDTVKAITKRPPKSLSVSGSSSSSCSSLCSATPHSERLRFLEFEYSVDHVDTYTYLSFRQHQAKTVSDEFLAD